MMQEKLNKLLQNSHSKYSNIKVAAIATNKKGTEYNGVNVENVAFSSTVCAERSAMLNAISHGVKPQEIQQIDLTSSISNFLYPCGSCCQVMLELMAPDGIINIWYNNNKKTKTLNELLPNKIQKESLGWK